MARAPVEEVEEDVVVEETEGEVEGDQPFLSSISGQTPWWIVSVVLHVLVILMASLVSMAFKLPPSEQPVVTMTELASRPDVKLDAEKIKTDSKLVMESKHDTPPTDPTAKNASDIVVPPDILAKAELSDHFETNNPDKEDTHSAFGNEQAHMFHSEKGSDDAAGGGGNQGASLDDAMIGVGGQSSPGSGGGWGGGHGTGTGVDTGAGHGSFGTRSGGGRKLCVMRHGGSKGTEDAVNAALRWLAYHQDADGHWDSKKYEGRKVDTAVTGLAILAFLGAGHTEKIGEYKDNVVRGIKWLKSKQAANGLVFDTTDEGGYRGTGYPNAIATMALVEAAGMANVPETVAAAQKAINYATELHQCGDGSEKLGFRYSAKQPGDTSVTGWYIMAIKSAKVSGLKVNTAAFDGAKRFLDAVEQKNAAQGTYGPASRYAYMPDGQKMNPRLSAIGYLSRLFLGGKKEELQSGVELFMKDGGVPASGIGGDTVDLYYWYYGTLCVFQMGGDIWKSWNTGMVKALCDTQIKGGDDAGSWTPKGDFSDDWGRVGQTALGCLCLEVYYRYKQLHPDGGK